MFCLDIFVEILIFTRYVWHHFGFGILLKEKGDVKHVAKHASIYRDHFLRHYFFGSFTFFSIHQIRHSTTSTLPLIVIKCRTNCRFEAAGNLHTSSIYANFFLSEADKIILGNCISTLPTNLYLGLSFKPPLFILTQASSAEIALSPRFLKHN